MEQDNASFNSDIDNSNNVTHSEDAPMQVSEDMSKEELLVIAQKALKKAHDQELGRKKYQEQVKQFKKLLEGEASTPEKPKEPTPEERSTALSREEIRLIQQGYSDSEIETIKSFAQSFRKSVDEVLQDDLLKSSIQRGREMRTTAMASIDSPKGNSVATSDKEFAKAVLSGTIDMNQPGNVKRYAAIAARMSSQ